MNSYKSTSFYSIIFEMSPHGVVDNVKIYPFLHRKSDNFEQ